MGLALRLPRGDCGVKCADTSPCCGQALASRPGTSPPTHVGQDLAQVMIAEATPRRSRAAGGVIACWPQASLRSHQLLASHVSPLSLRLAVGGPSLLAPGQTPAIRLSYFEILPATGVAAAFAPVEGNSHQPGQESPGTQPASLPVPRDDSSISASITPRRPSIGAGSMCSRPPPLHPSTTQSRLSRPLPHGARASRGNACTPLLCAAAFLRSTEML